MNWRQHKGSRAEGSPGRDGYLLSRPSSDNGSGRSVRNPARKQGAARLQHGIGRAGDQMVIEALDVAQQVERQRLPSVEKAPRFLAVRVRSSRAIELWPVQATEVHLPAPHGLSDLRRAGKLDGRLIEATGDLGASPWRIFLTIVLPPQHA